MINNLRSKLKPLPKTIATGQEAEDYACQYLEKNNLSVVAKNFHCRFGEIDLIMQLGNTLVFVEVKFRRSGRFGHAQEMVSKSKQQKIITTAQTFLSQYKEHQNKDCRFDVLALEYDSDKSLKVNWLTNAFYAEY